MILCSTVLLAILLNFLLWVLLQISGFSHRFQEQSALHRIQTVPNFGFLNSFFLESREPALMDICNNKYIAVLFFTNIDER